VAINFNGFLEILQSLPLVCDFYCKEVLLCWRLCKHWTILVILARCVSHYVSEGVMKRKSESPNKEVPHILHHKKLRQTNRLLPTDHDGGNIASSTPQQTTLTRYISILQDSFQLEYFYYSCNVLFLFEMYNTCRLLLSFVY